MYAMDAKFVMCMWALGESGRQMVLLADLWKFVTPIEPANENLWKFVTPIEPANENLLVAIATK